MSDTNGSKQGSPTPRAGSDLIQTRPICAARKKNGNGLCQISPMPNGRCRLHGGKTPGGVASPNYKHGRFSKYMPTRLLDRYNEAMKDPNLTHLRSDIAIIEALLAEKMQCFETGETASLWLIAQELAKEYRDALAGGDSRGPDVIFAELEVVLASGKQQVDMFAEIQPLLEQRRKTAESENKRLKDLNQTMTAEQAVSLVRVLADSVKRHVTDQKIVQAISEDFTRALSQ